MRDLIERQRLKMIRQCNALAKLFKVRLRNFVTQFRLADEHDLQQFVAGGFEIGEHAELFEHFVGEILRFVNDHDHQPILGKLLDQELIEAHEHRGFVGLGMHGDGKFVTDQADQLGGY